MDKTKPCILKATTIRGNIKYFIRYDNNGLPLYSENVKNSAVMSKSLAKKVKNRIKKTSNHKMEIIDLVVKDETI